MIMGDFNARAASEDDSIINDDLFTTAGRLCY